ncbi:MAG: DNA-directed RNA polymerase subunit RpoH/Rpb5 C-terminal domain-containing protein [Candidatus Aenigmarchaeota archaeon]|nr:DNA-directed RNA polymerase subunit H [Candidatus Aenigmarchaeota archaeon]MDW8149730.1 DNA-directed RNA polymerase subunit RpoH/Rpb5 C-terminal domain-containing protein [Candidatus Aenigmarchaeota archaeon]
MIDVKKHFLVPECEIISEKEKEELFKKYGKSLKRYPKIFSTDPLVRAIGAKVGDIIKIYRKEPHLKKTKTIYYRVVVEAK